MGGVALPVRTEQHLYRHIADGDPLRFMAALAQPKAAVLGATGSITPNPLELASEHSRQGGAVDAQQMVDVAPSAVPARITVESGTGEIGAAGDHAAVIDHHEFVVHQSTAAAAVLGVIQQRHAGLDEQPDGITVAGLLRSRDPIAIGIGQLLELVPAMPLVFGQVAGLLFAPGGAVAVLQHEFHLHTTPVSGDQLLGQAWQRQLLSGHQQAAVDSLDCIDNQLLQVITIAPLTRERGWVATALSVVEAEGKPGG